MSTAQDRITALAKAQVRLEALVEPLGDAAVEGPSYDSEWTVAKVLSHLGSSAEIFELFLDAGRAGADMPGPDQMQPIWEAWNAKSPRKQAVDAVARSRQLVGRFDSIDPAELDAVRFPLFGRDTDIGELARMRLAEQALHTWDVAVALDPAARVGPEAIEHVVDALEQLASWSGKAQDQAFRVHVVTADPRREFELAVTGEGVSLRPLDGSTGESAGAADAELRLPAEAFVRLVYGRLDPEHTPSGVELTGSVSLDKLRAVFPGF
jgi:uncharacterized protein (TIGR03083 family)